MPESSNILKLLSTSLHLLPFYKEKGFEGLYKDLAQLNTLTSRLGYLAKEFGKDLPIETLKLFGYLFAVATLANVALQLVALFYSMVALTAILATGYLFVYLTSPKGESKATPLPTSYDLEDAEQVPNPWAESIDKKLQSEIKIKSEKGFLIAIIRVIFKWNTQPKSVAEPTRSASSPPPYGYEETTSDAATLTPNSPCPWGTQKNTSAQEQKIDIPPLSFDMPEDLTYQAWRRNADYSPTICSSSFYGSTGKINPISAWENTNSFAY